MMKKKLSTKELNELLKTHTPKQLIYKYTMWKISLTSKQLDYLIELKNREDREDNGKRNQEKRI